MYILQCSPLYIRAEVGEEKWLTKDMHMLISLNKYWKVGNLGGGMAWQGQACTFPSHSWVRQWGEGGVAAFKGSCGMQHRDWESLMQTNKCLLAFTYLHFFTTFENPFQLGQSPLRSQGSFFFLCHLYCCSFETCTKVGAILQCEFREAFISIPVEICWRSASIAALICSLPSLAHADFTSTVRILSTGCRDSVESVLGQK